MSNGLSLVTNSPANNALYNLSNNTHSLDATYSKISTGLKINSPADNPSGYAIATNLQTQVAGYDQASEAIQNATNVAQVASGGLSSITDVLGQINSLVIQASSTLNSPSDLANIQGEVNQLVNQVNSIASSTEFNGTNLLNGSLASGATVPTGPNPGETQTISIPDSSASALGISGLSVLNGNPSADIPIVSSALSSVLSTQAAIGSASVALSYAADNNKVASVNLQASQSSIQDINTSSASTTANQNQLLQHVDMAVLAQANVNQKSLLNLVTTLGLGKKCYFLPSP